MTPGVVNAEVVIDVGSGVHIAAIVTQGSAREMTLAQGDEATVLFKALSVLVGTKA